MAGQDDCTECNNKRQIHYEDLPISDPLFGKVFPCPACRPKEYHQALLAHRGKKSLVLDKYRFPLNDTDEVAPSKARSNSKARAVNHEEARAPQETHPKAPTHDLNLLPSEQEAKAEKDKGHRIEEVEQIRLVLDVKKIPAVSFTEVSTFERCKHEFKYRFIDKKAKGNEQFTNPRLVVGSALHDTLHHFFKDFHGSERTLKNLKKSFESRFEAKWAMFLANEDDKEWHDMGEAALENYFSQNDCSIEPVALEESFDAPYVNLRLTGRIDRIDAFGEKGFEVIDYKYDSHSEEFISSKPLQAAFYYVGFYSQRKRYPAQVRFYHLDLGTNEIITLSSDDIAKTLNRVTTMLNVIQQPDAEYPPFRNSFCSFCPARPICPLFK